MLPLILCVVVACLSANVESSSKFRMASLECLNSSLSKWKRPENSESMLECIASSRSVSLQSVGVLQWNRRDSSCMLFRFSEVCQLLNLTNTGSSAHEDCKIVVDSDYDAIIANQHFKAVWVADRGPALENLVCGPDGQRNPVKSTNVIWSNDGVQMDGSVSRLWVDDPTGLDFTGSFTWVLHLKRTRGNNCFIELSGCSTIGNAVADTLHHFHEVSHGVPGRSLYLMPGKPGRPRRFQANTVLPSDPEQFIIAGASYQRTTDACNLFLDTNFLAEIMITDIPIAYNATGACIKIGWRSPTVNQLKGVIRAVAVTDSALSEDEIRQLFQSL